MVTPRIRPQLARPRPDEPAAFFTALAEHLGRDGTNVRGHTLDEGAILRLRQTDREVWSPALFLHRDGDSSGSWQVHGRFSPSSPVWTAFVAIYLPRAGSGARAWSGSDEVGGARPVGASPAHVVHHGREETHRAQAAQSTAGAGVLVVGLARVDAALGRVQDRGHWIT